MSVRLFGIFFPLAATFMQIQGQVYRGICDQERNVNLPFCDSSLSFDARIEDLISRLSIVEKIGLSGDKAKGANSVVELFEYNWWGEALKGVALDGDGGNQTSAKFRPPTEFATVFPQPINAASAFNKELFHQIAKAIGDEARAFYNVGNSDLTFWSPNLNIYRDPRWGRGHETPGEDPYLSGEYSRIFVQGLQENENEFLKASACCKHFAAHSIETDRFAFDAIVTPQDMADTYLPAFKTCVEDGQATCVMCAYSAVNGIPACVHHELLTVILRETWNFDGYVVTDCGAVSTLMNQHHYTNTTSETCRVVYEAGVDVACDGFLQQHLEEAILDGNVTMAMIDTALARGFRILMRTGYFEKDATRPYKDLGPSVVDSPEHRQVALQAARESIVLLKNGANLAMAGHPTSLPLDITQFRTRRASMALIGPHLNASEVFLANYHGLPSFTKTPLGEFAKRVPDLEYEFGCDLISLDNPHLDEAEALARASSQVVLFVGISARSIEYETNDRLNLTLPGLQNELIRRTAAAASSPVILVLLSGGPVDLGEWKFDPRIGAIIYAGYMGQAGGEAIADVVFGTYNPSGRLAHTFYSNANLENVHLGNMNVRPEPATSYPGRTYRFFTGTPEYEFGHGLSYTNFQYSWAMATERDFLNLGNNAGAADDECSLEIYLNVRNVGAMAGDHSLLAFLSPPNAGQMGRPIKSLVDFEKVANVMPNFERLVTFCLTVDKFQLANENGQFEIVTGMWVLTVGSLQRNILVT